MTEKPPFVYIYVYIYVYINFYIVLHLVDIMNVQLYIIRLLINKMECLHEISYTIFYHIQKTLPS